MCHLWHVLSTVEKGVDVCNTHPTIKIDHLAVVERGVDTWRLARYLDDDRALRRAVAMMPQGRFPDRLSGHVVGVLPGQRMLWIEGHPQVDGLADPAALEDLHGRLLEQLDLIGLARGRDAGIARVDATVTVKYDDPRQGRAVLTGLSALDVPRCKPVVYGKPAQTVYLQGSGSKKVLGRIYDKGIEAALGVPGSLVRFEDQRRYTKETRRAVENLETGQQFERRFAAMRKSADGVKVASLPVLSREVCERVNSGELARPAAERMLGYLVLEQVGARSMSPATMTRRRRELREGGMVLAEGIFEPVEVDLGETLEQVLEAWR